MKQINIFANPIKIIIFFILFNTLYGDCKVYELRFTESTRYYREDLGLKMFHVRIGNHIKYTRRFPFGHKFQNIATYPSRNLIRIQDWRTFNPWMEAVRNNMKKKHPNKIVKLTYSEHGGASIEPQFRKHIYYLFVVDKEEDQYIINTHETN